MHGELRDHKSYTGRITALIEIRVQHVENS
jgi:hypothetical protein